MRTAVHRAGAAAAPPVVESTPWTAARAAVWLSGVIAASIAVRIATAHATVAPFIFPDELIYTELARGFTEDGSFTVAGAPFSAWSYGPLYPVLIAPVYALATDAEMAYAAVKIMNAVLVSLAAVPAYLLARRFVGSRAAVLFAAVTVSVPSLIYSTKVMTESLAYPLFLWAVLSMQRALEQPRGRRWIEVLAVIGVAVLSRAQMVVLLPAFVTALAGVRALDRADRAGSVARVSVQRPARVRLAWLTLAVAFVTGSLVGVTLGPGTVLGLHTRLMGRLDVTAAPRWFLYHLAELDLAAGVVPLAAFGVLVLAVRKVPRQIAVFVATTVSITAWMLALVAVYATQPAPHPQIYERYLFYLLPLLVLGLFAWTAERMPRPRGARVMLIAAALLPLLVPFHLVLASRKWGVSTATVGLVPWGLARAAFGSLLPVYVGTGILLGLCAALLLRARPEAAGRLRLWALGYFLAVGLVVQAANVAVADKSARFGVARSDAAWIDRLVGTGAKVDALWTGNAEGGWAEGYGVWDNAFFNRSVRTTYTLRGDFPAHWVATRARLRGTLVTVDGKPIKPEFVLGDPTTRVLGTVVGRDRATGMTLYRVSGPLHVWIVADAR
jgi:hypothetical protein